MRPFSALFLFAGWAAWPPPPDAPAPPGPPEVLKVVFTEEQRPLDPSSDTLFYHQRHATAEDFRGSPGFGARSDAVSFTSFGFDGSTRRFRDTLEVHLVLQVFWVRSASWTRTRPPSRHILVHEQLHFDITRLVAERFRKKVLSMPLTIDDHDSRIQYEYLESFREMNQLQEAFDDEARHGANGIAEARWQQRIHSALREEGVMPAQLP
ncbi:DUF922 domain-containing protein [Chitinophaga caseinilytica]|uniref:DUF922 domain-containing protein n=1 Tax=Chitinophaga caseinilytica TaxID=2267521 RepID=A0ABZ2Z5D7_9BACT